MASAVNGGRELSPSSALCGGFVLRDGGSGEKQSLAYGSTKSSAEHHESTLRAGGRKRIFLPFATPAKIPALAGIFVRQCLTTILTEVLKGYN